MHLTHHACDHLLKAKAQKHGSTQRLWHVGRRHHRQVEDRKKALLNWVWGMVVYRESLHGAPGAIAPICTERSLMILGVGEGEEEEQAGRV